jgi:hypothetical protein
MNAVVLILPAFECTADSGIYSGRDIKNTP